MKNRQSNTQISQAAWLRNDLLFPIKNFQSRSLSKVGARNLLARAHSWWTGRDLNPRPPECKVAEETALRLSNKLEEFKEFLLVDLRRSEKTAYEQTRIIRRFLETLNKDSVSREYVRSYLKQISGEATYRNTLASLKRFFRDYLEMPQIVATFRFPAAQFKPKRIPSKKNLRRFYEAIDLDIGKVLFLFYATSGLRKNEVLSLMRNDIDLSKRMVTPNCHSGSTKHSYVSFINDETEAALKKVMGNDDKLFPISERQYRRIWKVAKNKTGIHITPQMLRDWFCEEMGRLGVQDRYIDAFCGRTPKSVLARHYTDYRPEKLKEIYDKAGLRVLS